jgi:thymidylate synthase (FAD)
VSALDNPVFFNKYYFLSMQYNQFDYFIVLPMFRTSLFLLYLKLCKKFGSEMKKEIKEILGEEIKCLDKGFVRLIDVMGDDDAIVQAARVSYGKGTKTRSMDRELIRYLMRHRHTSPFEMVELKFHVKLPIFVARQWIRHRTANVNEYSGRYSEMRDEFYVPEIEQVRPQSSSNRQGRSDEALPEEKASEIARKMAAMQKFLFEEYQAMLEGDLTRELARINLPLSTYTEWYWKIDLHNLLHFLKLRTDWHAQYEIRVYADTIAEMVSKIVPITWEAFEDYVLYGISFSRNELGIISEMLSGMELDAKSLERNGINGLEASEFKKKFSVFLK